MQLFTGSPLSLKKHFLQNLQEIKTNPLERVLVLIPSKHLETRLKKELCQKIPCLAGVHFMPLSALAREINQTAATPVLPLADDSPLLDFKVKHLLHKYGFSANRDLAICFKNSFRDLINAEVTPQALSEVKEDASLILTEQKEYLDKFIPMYADFLEIQKEKGKSTYKDFFIAARNNAQNNIFLNSFKKIIFYGFYDFTSLHFELIKAIIDNYKEKTQVYLPYENNPAYSFAEITYKTLFLPLASEHKNLESEINPIKTAGTNIFTPEQTPTDADIKIIKISGEGEVQAAAKQILELHKQGVNYEDIALTFRGENNFSTKILEVFKQNQIPINYNFSFPLLQKPFAAFIYNLFNLESGNFAREDVASVVNAPYFNKKEDFSNLIQQSGAECSIEQFEEMLSNENPELKTALLDILKEIKVYINILKQGGSFQVLAQRARDFIIKFTSEKALKEQAETFRQIKDILDIIFTYSTTGKDAKYGEFLEEFFDLLGSATFNKVISAPSAVEVADIMTLRLQDFKVVIIIGLNEGIFPLIPQEDPALKEIYRRSLREKSRKPLRSILQSIGYLIHTRQNRFLEENFLFYLALSAAQKKAVLTYKTSDEEGKDTVQSIFITLLLNVLRQQEENLPAFSRRPLERLENDIKQEFLTKEEAANLIALSSPNAKELLGNILAKAEEEKDSIEEDYLSLKTLSSNNELTAFDGIINPESAKQIYPQYFSPSSLSILFTCPARYFFSRIIKDDDEKFLRGKLSEKHRGNLYHYILASFYESIKNKLPQIPWSEAENLFKNFIEKYFQNTKQTKYGLYPLLWEAIKREITEDLLAFIKKDLENMQNTNFFPAYFEKEESCTLPLSNGDFKLQARIDRIDLKPDSKEGIAIDYKSTYKSNIWEQILTYSKLQPPIYLEILNKKDSPIHFSSASFAFIKFTVKIVPIKSLTFADFNKEHQKFTDLFTFLHELTLSGIYPITPDEDVSCQYCDYCDICRKNHLQTLRRAKRSSDFKKLKDFHYVDKQKTARSRS